jgi:hypothetical protein
VSVNIDRILVRVWIVLSVAWGAFFGWQFRVAQVAHEDAVNAVRAANVTHRTYESAGLPASASGELATPDQEELVGATESSANRALVLLIGGLVLGTMAMLAVRWILAGARAESRQSPRT